MALLPSEARRAARRGRAARLRLIRSESHVMTSRLTDLVLVWGFDLMIWI